MTRSRLRASVGAVGAVVLSLALLAGCGDDDTSDDNASGEGATTSIPDESRPPTKFSELEAIFDPLVEPLGLKITRGALIDRSDNGYEVSDQGRHLALYAEPIDDDGSTAELAVANFYDLTAIVAPYVFERWSELDTFDICQEPPTSVDDRPEPYPDTQIDLTRQATEAFDWDNADLVDLLHLDLTDGEVRTVIADRVRDTEPFAAAYAQAQQRLGDAISTTTLATNLRD